MHTTVTDELAEAEHMSADDYDEIVEEYCGTKTSPRTTYVIARTTCDRKWFVGEGVCFSFLMSHFPFNYSISVIAWKFFGAILTYYACASCCLQ